MNFSLRIPYNCHDRHFSNKFDILEEANSSAQSRLSKLSCLLAG